ncbi:GrpB family protein [Actinoplanes sp. CA-252034]|uniref:GrpB family protein n=1 Tax=Actinoplanes sp. CA-252034 TaxID=3239906 RepID=UPI003D9546AD
MTGESPIDRQRQDPIEIVPYDSGWPAAFDRQRARVEAVLKPWIAGPVEHIGSTSIPGMSAKPIIDMAARTPDYQHTVGLAEAMAGIGWVHAPEPGDEQARKWSFCFPDIARRTHHLHIFEVDADSWQSLLTFRDHMRTHPGDAAEYGRLKTLLAAADAHDRPRYRAAKAPFIRDLLKRIESSDP